MDNIKYLSIITPEVRKRISNLEFSKEEIDFIHSYGKVRFKKLNEKSKEKKAKSDLLNQALGNARADFEKASIELTRSNEANFLKYVEDNLDPYHTVVIKPATEDCLYIGTMGRIGIEDIAYDDWDGWNDLCDWNRTFLGVFDGEDNLVMSKICIIDLDECPEYKLFKDAEKKYKDGLRKWSNKDAESLNFYSKFDESYYRKNRNVEWLFNVNRDCFAECINELNTKFYKK